MVLYANFLLYALLCAIKETFIHSFCLILFGREARETEIRRDLEERQLLELLEIDAQEKEMHQKAILKLDQFFKGRMIRFLIDVDNYFLSWASDFLIFFFSVSWMPIPYSSTPSPHPLHFPHPSHPTPPHYTPLPNPLDEQDQDFIVAMHLLTLQSRFVLLCLTHTP